MTDQTERSVVALRALIGAGEQFRHAVAEQFHLTVSETAALSHLASEPRSPRELARLLGLTPSAITSVLDRLESVGLAARAAHPTDRRKMLVSITPAGQKVMDWARGRLSKVLRGIDDGYGPIAADLLFELAAGLSSQVRPELR